MKSLSELFCFCLHVLRRHPLWLLLVCCAFHDSLSQGTGFFRVEQMDGHWQIIDPDGRPFHMRGMLHYSDGQHMPWNLQEKYGSAEQWRKSVKQRHIDLGFTYLPPSIGPVAIDPSAIGDKPRTRENLVTRAPEWPVDHYVSLEYPFTIFLEVPKQYMAGSGLPDVFSDSFKEAVDERCRKQVQPLRNNRNLIGYHFAHNPPWNINVRSAESWIEACTQPGSQGIKAWARLMQRIYGSIDRWRETYGIPIKSWGAIETLDRPLRGYIFGSKLREDKEAFLKLICDQWYKVYHEAIRKYDMNHLILGDRNTLHLQDAPSPWAFYIMSRYIDVLSVNVMGPPPIIYKVLSVATRNWTGPILLSDTGAGIYQSEPPKSTYQARDMEEFEQVYGGLVQMSIQHPQIVGFGWCGYYETPHPGGRSGLMDVVTDEPLPHLVPIITHWNAKMDAHVDSLIDP